MFDFEIDGCFFTGYKRLLHTKVMSDCSPSIFKPHIKTRKPVSSLQNMCERPKSQPTYPLILTCHNDKQFHILNHEKPQEWANLKTPMRFSRRKKINRLDSDLLEKAKLLMAAKKKVYNERRLNFSLPDSLVEI
jgi:hypothetical protein